MITVNEFMKTVPCNRATAELWQPHIVDAAEKWGIDTRRRVAGFIAQMSFESGRFTRFSESLDYSVDGLARTFPTRFSVNHRDKIKQPTLLAQQFGRTSTKPANQLEIANHVYGGRYGNRPGTDDGWLYRGRGPKQITFRDNYIACGLALNVPLEETPSLLLQPSYGAAAAAWYWSTHNCNELIDEANYVGVTRAINGGLNGFEDGNMVGLDDRMELHLHANMVLGVA